MLATLVDSLQAIVRPIVTLGFAGATVAGWLLGRLSDDAFLGIAGLVIGFWFQRREDGRPTTSSGGGG
jgi:hypothetical protein